MKKSWPEPVERVVQRVQEANVEARVEEFPEGAATASDAARATGAKLQRSSSRSSSCVMVVPSS